MILTHEQAHTAHKIMLLAIAGGAEHIVIDYGMTDITHHCGGRVVVDTAGAPVEDHGSPDDFATAYDVAGTEQRHEYTKAAQSWEAFSKYMAPGMMPCAREQFERLSVAGRVTKMMLGLWA